jgi:hypothetical protein
MIEPSTLRGVYAISNVPANVPVTPEVVPTTNDNVTSLVPTFAIIAAAAVVVAGTNEMLPPAVVGVMVPIAVAPTFTVMTKPVNADGAVVSNKRTLLIIEPAGRTISSLVVGEPTWYVKMVPAAFTPEKVTCWDAEVAPVLSGAMTPLFVGLLRLKIRNGVENVLDMFISLS